MRKFVPSHIQNMDSHYEVASLIRYFQIHIHSFNLYDFTRLIPVIENKVYRPTEEESLHFHKANSIKPVKQTFSLTYICSTICQNKCWLHVQFPFTCRNNLDYIIQQFPAMYWKYGYGNTIFPSVKVVGYFNCMHQQTCVWVLFCLDLNRAYLFIY